ncbi:MULTISPECIES: DUF2280 domain-containing protein [Klebsiella pneumoniae complex]|uniref:Uncharacterized conserved protein n=1 Tax=Klebsiella quasipneumoniae TaxID=1463165 RepID=A0ABD7N1S4_9ENTR|nr:MULTISPECIES: DUF2280 domain-containing protein [Klebsiella]HCQ8124599.1 DUF2280 domain-containing protein [Klebsiella quasipneumoniae subsp. similipneumoniae]MCS5748436.1 DUF2280 domain-containing protein [Klebsiella quasipneumoniae subsp. quasipneumoniae]MCY0071162.1 DUF2280 domain-containing protein [Klebsiella pneumoniae]PLJ70739.1 hypothetical protein B6J71_16765 [Klebsiella quasipneumoniae]SSF74102.1 Uncharacterized conserved protein [Klebsiella quasipneumoniae]
MAALSTEVKAFIVQSLACFEKPARVIELVKAEFGIVVSRQQVSQYSPGNAMAAKLSKKWVDLFNATRERFQTEISDIPIANRAYRLRVLDRVAEKAESMKNYVLTIDVMERAAKEVGDAYSNKHKVEHSGPNGGAIQTITMSKEEYKSARQEMLEDDDC